MKLPGAVLFFLKIFSWQSLRMIKYILLWLIYKSNCIKNDYEKGEEEIAKLCSTCLFEPS